MFSNESLYNELDSYNSGNRLFNLNDTPNIWSSDKMYPTDNNFFNKNRNVYSTSLQMSDRFTRSNRKPPGDRSETNLIINYLPDGFYEKELFDLFSKAGTIIHYHVVKNKDQRSECYGFVDFEKAADAEKAIEMFHQYPIQNKKLKVQNAAEGLLIKEEEKCRAMNGFNNIGYKVEIRHAPIRWTVNDVKNVFGKYGEIVKVIEHTLDENIEINPEIKMKTFGIIFRYQTIAQKVVKKKNNQIAEPMWPLELELTYMGQEIVDIPVDSSRTSRPRSTKLRFDEMSNCSWENKFETKFDNAAYYPKNYETQMFSWNDSVDTSRPGMPLTSNGRPILKHKDNLMHLNGGVYDVISIDPIDKWNNAVVSGNSNNVYFDSQLRGSCNDIKAIWESKETITTDPIPQDIYVKTPLLPSRIRNEEKGKYKANVWFKMENMQPSGSFKLRGMAYWCYKAKLDGIQFVVSSSGGNAGLAAAYACRLLKLKCTVVVPITTPIGIIRDLLKENAEVIQEGSCWKDAHMKAESIVASYPRISRLVHPFDNSLLWSGYESIVDEIIADLKGVRLDMIVLSVGGGGMLNGVAQGIIKHKLQKTTAILAMETEGSSCFNRSIAMNKAVSIVPDSVATSLGASSVSQRTWELYSIKALNLFSKVCTDAEAIDSCYQFLNDQNCLVEPACGASLSAVYNGTLDNMVTFRECDMNIVVIVCGGRCIDIQTLLEMRQACCGILSNPTPYETGYDNLSNYDVTDRFLTMNVNKESYNQPADSGIFYGSPCRFDSSVPNYNQMFPSITKQSETNTTNRNMVHKTSILTENKFSFHRNNSENTNYSNFNFQSLNTNNNTSINSSNANTINTNVNNDTMYLVNDVMSSPVGSQHSDKENREN